MWAVFDGDPDDSIDTDLQMWAMLKYQEFAYRKYFHLSKKQMDEEPIDDFAANLELMRLIEKKSESDQALLEEKSRHGVR